MTLRGISYRLDQLRRRTAFAVRGGRHYARLRPERNGHRPSVAAVVVGRNDDYMPDFDRRLRATIAWNVRYFVDEVVFVEWNPPADRELLSLSLTKQFDRLRAYIVPADIHQTVCRNSHLALMEYHAKNVGIRRAESQWILATNADVALGPDTVRTLHQSLSSSDIAWTAQRVDISWDEGRQRPIGVFDCLRYRQIIPYQSHGTGDFTLASRELWNQVRGYDESLVKHRIGCDIRGVAQMLAHGADTRKAGIVLHFAHPTSCVEELQPHHGEWASLNDLPYHNGDDWGLNNCREKQIAERVWMLE